MQSHIYKMLEKEIEAEQIIQRSKFISYAKPVRTRQAAREYIAQTGQLHPQANHCCWAYSVFYPAHKEEYFSDAGEPSGTAGAPILAAIKGSEIKNIVIVVVRYFGGVKLGVRGLIDAYRSSASIAIEAANIIECQRRIVCQSICNYSQYESLKYLIEKCDGKLDSSDFSSQVLSLMTIPEIRFNEFEEKCKGRGLRLSIIEKLD